jgi:catechol 2,3-dioxygenase-like lactoylglutathione lyase family enzyme
MSNTQVRSETAIETPRARTVDMKLEVIVIPVSDVDRAKRFYGGFGWRLDADVVRGDEFRVVQFTPPGSPCSIIFGTGVVDRGVDVSELFHDVGGAFHHAGREGRLSGPDAARRSYASFASFSDPDGPAGCSRRSPCDCPDAWTRTTRHSPRRPSSRPRSAERRLRTASTRSGPATKMRTGPDWYAEYVVREQTGKQLPS